MALISADGLIQAAATMIVGLLFLTTLRQAIEPKKPITRGFVFLMLVPAYIWTLAIVVVALRDVMMLWMTPDPRVFDLLGEQGIRLGMLLFEIGLFTFICIMAYTSVSARRQV
jgi:hypothetical protein